MAEIWIKILVSDPQRSEDELRRDVRRFLAARGAFKRMVSAMTVVAPIEGFRAGYQEARRDE